MKDARFQAGGGEGALDEAATAAGPFDGDEAVAELMVGEGLADVGHGCVEVGSVVGDGGGRDEDAAVEVGEEELGAGLGAVEAEDCRSVRVRLAGRGDEAPHGACRRWRPAGREEGRRRLRMRVMRGASTKGTRLISFWQRAAGRASFFDKTNIPGDASHLIRLPCPY